MVSLVGRDRVEECKGRGVVSTDGQTNVLVTSYTFSSTIMYIPFSASLYSATSATVNCFDMFG